MTPTQRPHAGILRDDLEQNPNAIHDFHSAKRRPKNVPQQVHPIMAPSISNTPKDPGHPYAQTTHISFEFFNQRQSNAPFGYEHYVSLPPAYDEDRGRQWPLILFLHGAGESQRGPNESYASIRHGIPKVILCYDRLKSGHSAPAIDIPLAPRLKKSKQSRQADQSSQPVPPNVCCFLAENFVTVSPSLNMECGYGWNAPVLSALLDEVVARYRIDLDRVHVTGFSMGGYGTWDLAMYSPKRFATLAPVCGGGDVLRAALLAHVPHWVHHGDKDDIIPVRASEQMVRALEVADAPCVQFTRYAHLGHDCWTATYAANPELYEWMLRTRRPKNVKGHETVVPEDNKTLVAGVR